MSDTRELLVSAGKGGMPRELNPKPPQKEATWERVKPPLPRVITLRDIRNHPRIRTYLEKANEQMAVIGYSEHGLRHAALVAAIARNICLELGMEVRTAELAAIAGYLHDIGNCVHRFYHPQIGATMAFQLLDAMDMEAQE